MSQLRFGLYYDFRNPAAWKQPYDRLYSETLDQIQWAENHGYDDVWLSEHHLIDDGYLPSVLPVAAAIAARTKHIRILTAVLLMPFHNPIRLAEDIAVVDVMSGGRFELGVGAGYKAEEFESFGVPFKERGGRTNEGLEIISRLLAGETFTFKGKYYEVTRARVTPEPIQKPRPPIWVGGSTMPAIRRAARYGDGFVGRLGKLYAPYLAELRKVGRPTENLRLAASHSWLIASEDPEKTFNEAADHVIYQNNVYAEWNQKVGVTSFEIIRDRAHLRALGKLTVADPDTCIRIIRETISQTPLTHTFSWTLPPGLPPSWAQPHLELFANKVIPAFR